MVSGFLPSPATTAPHHLRQYHVVGSFVGCGNIWFHQLATQAADCNSGTLFVALSGSAHRQGEFLREAARHGACGVLTDFPLPDLEIPQCIVKDVRLTYGRLCQALADRPAEKLNILGVTGTNGKTTVTWMLRSILRQAGLPTGLLGTIEYDDGKLPPEPARLTTPDAAILADWTRRMVQQGTTHLVMEVSSHALDQQRVAGLKFRTAVLTNITRDHLDYHGSLPEYLRAKQKIVDYCTAASFFVVNGDDAHSRELLQNLNQTDSPACPIVTVGQADNNRVRLELLEQNLTLSRFRLLISGETLELTVPMPGIHNVYNAALAATAARLNEVPISAIEQGLKTLLPPPGRMQPVCAGQPFVCLVDYAHTPDAMTQVLQSLRPLVTGKIICLFGAGGNRDREKRPEMARAALLADKIVLTTDNCRNEPVEQIFAEILQGFPPHRQPDQILPDRAEAIDWGVQQAQPGDCLLILGKGHETTQQIAEETRHFDDVQQALQTIRKRNLSSQ